MSQANAGREKAEELLGVIRDCAEDVYREHGDDAYETFCETIRDRLELAFADEDASDEEAESIWIPLDDAERLEWRRSTPSKLHLTVHYRNEHPVQFIVAISKAARIDRAFDAGQSEVAVCCSSIRSID